MLGVPAESKCVRAKIKPKTDECLPREAGPYPRHLLLPLAARTGYGDEGKGRPLGFPLVVDCLRNKQKTIFRFFEGGNKTIDLNSGN